METESEHNSIPLNWYSLYLISNNIHLPDPYREDDYAKLYQTMYDDENEKINFLFEKSNVLITRYGLNLRNLEKINNRIRKELMKSKQIEKFIKIDKFIKYGYVEICIRSYVKEEICTNEAKNFFDMINPFKLATKSYKKKDLEEDDK